MSITTLKLNEASEDVFKYIDDYTGDIYYFNGEELVKIGNTGKKRQTQIGDKPSFGDAKDQLDKEDEMRDKLAKKHNEEDGIADETDEEKRARLQRIKDNFESDDISKELNDETERITGKSKTKVYGDNDTSYIYEGGLEAFKVDLQKLLKREFGDVRNPSWNNPDMSYEDTGLFVQGKKRKKKEGKKPVFQVYYDQSGSWGPDDIALGNDAIAILNDYVKKDLLELRIFYFADSIHDSPPGGGGTRAGAKIMEHIKSTKPDNIIIMTDDDLDWQDDNGKLMRDFPPLKVPGAVWHLFRGRASKDVQSHIRGRKQTKSYMI